VEVVGYL